MVDGRPMADLLSPETRRHLSLARLAAGLGLAAVVVPTVVSLARQHWSSPEGTQGPIILATGGWLLWRSRAVLRREAAPLANPGWLLPFPPLALTYAFARAFGILSLEAATAYALTLLAAVIYLGPGLIRRFWFPFLYPAFLIPPPAMAVAELTQPLRMWISAASVDLLHLFGYPVALAGVTIQVAQYELLVRTACAGLGSMLTLCAVGLFYVHLRRDAGTRYSGVLLAAIIPIAVLANLVRVLLLILLTMYFGVAIAQGVAHDLAGLLMFCIAMIGLFATDSALSAAGADGRLRHA